MVPGVQEGRGEGGSCWLEPSEEGRGLAVAGMVRLGLAQLLCPRVPLGQGSTGW